MSAKLPQTRPSVVQISEWLKNHFYESSALQYPYASWMDLQSKAAAFRGQPYEATSRLLHMWKQLGTERFGPARMARFWKLLRENCYSGEVLLTASENRLRQEFVCSPKAKQLRKIYGAFAPEHRVRLRYPNDEDPERQGDLMILKPHDPESGERGVLMIKYSESILAMPARL